MPCRKSVRDMHKKITENLYKIALGGFSCHCYLVVGDQVVLIDTGAARDYPVLAADLNDLGFKQEDIDIVINTHEHFDHIGGNIEFQKTALIAAHRHTAIKVTYSDDEAMMCQLNNQRFTDYRVTLWLGNTDVITTGNWFLKVLHTPGHTSGSISLYEPRKRMLFSGDTLFASGTLSTIFASGSLGEYFNSLRRLRTMKIDLLLPGHGNPSDTVEEDIELTIENAMAQFPDAERLAALF